MHTVQQSGISSGQHNTNAPCWKKAPLPMLKSESLVIMSSFSFCSSLIRSLIESMPTTCIGCDWLVDRQLGLLGVCIGQQFRFGRRAYDMDRERVDGHGGLCAIIGHTKI